MSMEAALQTYFTEAREMLEDMEAQLLEIEQQEPEDLPETLNAIFRAAHTVKGSASLFGLDGIVDFTHVVENLLDRMRDGDVGVSPELISLLLRCQDHIATLVDESEADGEVSEDSRILSRALIVELGAYLEDHAAPDADKAGLPSAGTAVEPASGYPVNENDETVDNDCWHISLRFGRNSFRDGFDPISFLRFLENIGSVRHILILDDWLPDLADYDPEDCYLGFEIRFMSSATKKEIEDVFEFIREDSDIHILAPYSRLSDYIDLVNAMSEDSDRRIGEILVECGALTEAELAKALALQTAAEEADQSRRLGEIVTQDDDRLTPVVDAAAQKQSQMRDAINRKQKSLRVDADKLDHLINLVGELVTAGAGTFLQAQILGNPELVESMSKLNDLLEEMRDASLKLRMVAIGATFSKFQRVVRDMAGDLDKEVDLAITGADTELDKSVVEKIGDPLMHLVRNAVDHGLESSAEREAAGKPVTGTISLNAYHDSGNIVIEVGDDGRGLDPDKILAKAREKGMVGEDQQLSRAEIFDLILRPGFSTAEKVSNISGRGVGMDVVRRNVIEMRGRTEIDSAPGEGTTIRIILPLTLAIIDGFVVGVGKAAFVVPLDVVQECVEFSEVDQTERDGQTYINLRGNVLPLVNIRHRFGVQGERPKRRSVVVVRAEGQSVGLVVDRLMGEFQTVIKPLGPVFTGLSGISGSTIMGSGEVALILDVQGLVQQITRGERTAANH
ncbi:MAG: chemotaxis protein CheA [Wenzhouxiangella sp.]